MSQSPSRCTVLAQMLAARGIPYLELPRPASLAAIRISDGKFYVASNAEKYITPPLRGV